MLRLTAILLLAASALAQSVDGTLSDSITHLPISNVIVTLLGPVRYDNTTDEAGTFHFPKIQPGKYFFNIVKAGYVLPTAHSGPFQVDADTRLSVEMHPLGRVEGRVRYSDGRPAPRATVTLTGAGHNYTGNADPGGHFLVEDVASGSYVLRATEAVGIPRVDGEVWAPTYFPGTIDSAAAEPIPVSYGLTVTREIRLRSVPARRVRGVIRDETGQLAAGASVRLENQTVVTGADGIFEFVTRDGAWRVTGTRKEGDVERRGIATVVVSRHDLEDVEISLALPFSVPLIFESDDDRVSGSSKMQPVILLSRVDDVSQLVHATSDKIRDIYPGRYTIQVMGGLSRSYVESIKLGEVEVNGRAFDLWDGSQPIHIRLRQDGASIHGNVENAATATVVVVDADGSVTTNRRRVYSFSGARFDVGQLHPGDYYVFAVDRPTPLDLTELVMRALLQRAEKVHLNKSGVATITLKVVPWP